MAEEEPSAPYSPTQTLSLLHNIGDRLDAIRIYMGKSKGEIPQLDVKGAVAPEAYYQALNLYQKADRLALEITRTTQPLPAIGQINQSSEKDIYNTVHAAQGRIELVAKELGITTQTDNLPTSDQATISDVYEEILRTNQYINQLLDKQYSPSDVYQQVTNALHITLTLFEKFPGERRIVEPPELIPGKRPTDVYALLLDCYGLVREIATLSKIEILQLTSIPKQEPYIPSEVYDIATLLTSELSYIHTAVPGLSEPAKSYFPERKFPSDVFQRGGLLQQTLIKLRTLISQNQDWRQAESRS